MMNDFCSKCENEACSYKRFGVCGHIICHDCFIKSLLEDQTIHISFRTIIKCMVPGCNNKNNYLIEDFIEEFKSFNYYIYLK